MKKKTPLSVFLLVLFLIVSSETAFAVTIGEITESSVFDQVKRFFSFEDRGVVYTLVGALLMGISCGSLGSFLVVRKMALLGDTLSHAVLPGVAVGFLWSMEKNPLFIFIGAVISGLLGTFVVSLIEKSTKLKSDAALGIVLASFFAVGSCLVTWMQRVPQGNKGGIQAFLFGQVSALQGDDLALMLIVTVCLLIFLCLFFRSLKTVAFDYSFAAALGMPVRRLHHGFMFVLACAVVMALQAVGVVLVSALLVIPAATARLFTNRLEQLLFGSVVLSTLAAFLGAFLSFLYPGLPTGPFIVIVAACFFLGVFLFNKHSGLVGRWYRHTKRDQKMRRENVLKEIYRYLEGKKFVSTHISLPHLLEIMGASLSGMEKTLRQLVQRKLLKRKEKPVEGYVLTPAGIEMASSVLRNHRLWELYLSSSANYRADHVHEDAEKIEHILGENIVRQLEEKLNYPERDPHGKPIPPMAERKVE